MQHLPNQTSADVATVDRTTADRTTALVEQHLDLVHHVVFQVAARLPRHVDRDELSRAGALGLVEAARRFDAGRGVPFSGYATQRIRGAILDAVRATDWAPRSVREIARRLERVEQQLAFQLGRVPSVAETAAALDVSRDDLDRLRDDVFRSLVLTLDAPGGTDDGASAVETMADESTPEPCEELERRELHAFVRDAVAMLPERHRAVVVGSFLDERSSDDLARYLGVTVSRVSQMRTEAMEMMRQGIEAQFVEHGDASPAPSGIVARRRDRYARAITAASTCADRITLPVDLRAA